MPSNKNFKAGDTVYVFDAYVPDGQNIESGVLLSASAYTRADMPKAYGEFFMPGDTVCRIAMDDTYPVLVLMFPERLVFRFRAEAERERLAQRMTYALSQETPVLPAGRRQKIARCGTLLVGAPH